MSKILVMSDLHMEWGNKITVDKVDGVDFLVLAGDIGNYKSHLPFIEECAKHYKVIYVLGNHEFYLRSLKEVRDFWASVNIQNFYFLDNSSVVIDGIEFIGSTLWVNFNNGSPHCLMNAAIEIKDFQKITNEAEDDCISSHEIYREFQKSYDYLKSVIYTKNENKKVLVTHYGISHQSVNEKYLTNSKIMELNHYFTSNLDYFIGESEVKLAVHGHMHNSCDYMLGDVRVVCNPLGYPQSINEAFDKAKVIEI